MMNIKIRRLNTPKESSQEIFALPEGYQAAELKIPLSDLWDEFGTDFKGVLTYETEGAPGCSI